LTTSMFVGIFADVRFYDGKKEIDMPFERLDGGVVVISEPMKPTGFCSYNTSLTIQTSLSDTDLKQLVDDSAHCNEKDTLWRARFVSALKDRDPDAFVWLGDRLSVKEADRICTAAANAWHRTHYALGDLYAWN